MTLVPGRVLSFASQLLLLFCSLALHILPEAGRRLTWLLSPLTQQSKAASRSSLVEIATRRIIVAGLIVVCGREIPIAWCLMCSLWRAPSLWSFASRYWTISLWHSLRQNSS